MSDPVESFLSRFRRFGDGPSSETYLALFHPEATLFDAGMPRPITVSEIPEHIEGILQLVPDFRMTPERVRHRDGTVFVEAHNQASLAGSLTEWRSVYCIDLAGDQVMRGRRYYDRRALYARLDPSLPSLPPHSPVSSDASIRPERFTGPEAVVKAFGEAWQGSDPEALVRLFREDGTLARPELDRPLARSEVAHYHGALSLLFSGLEMELISWAGDDALCFAEWRITANVAGERFSQEGVDRFDLAGGGVLACRAYFDTLGLAQRLAAATQEGAS